MSKKNVVIVGAGTAGLVIANNLQHDFNVTIVERSKFKSYPSVYKIPMMIGILFRKKKQKYIRNIELTLSDKRKIPFFESQVFGGASLINGCVHVFGAIAAWSNILEGFGFSIKDLFESYSRCFSKNAIEKYKISIRFSKITDIDKAFLSTLNRMGIPLGDMDSSDAQNCGQIYNTIRKVFRSSVLSLMSKNHFSLLMNENVTNFAYDENGEVVGVNTSNGIISGDYVILAAGTLGTNRLMLGEVQRGVLNSVNHNNVGANIQDHINLRINVIANKEINSLNEIEHSLIKKAKILFSHLCGKPTILSGTGATSGVHLDLNGDGRVDVRVQVLQFTESGRHGSDGRYFGNMPGFSLSITPIQPFSKGLMGLRDGNFFVDPGYLNDDRDIDLLISALNYCLNLLGMEPLNGYVQEIIGEELIRSDPKKYILENIYSGHHLIGGLGQMVDENFRVKGLESLYVCDASVFQEYAASNIHSSVVLLADLFSRRFIKINS